MNGPCTLDDCGCRCFFDEDNGWCVAGTRGGNGDPEEDVLFSCLCDHHEETKP